MEITNYAFVHVMHWRWYVCRAFLCLRIFYLMRFGLDWIGMALFMLSKPYFFASFVEEFAEKKMKFFYYWSFCPFIDCFSSGFLFDFTFLVNGYSYLSLSLFVCVCVNTLCCFCWYTIPFDLMILVLVLALPLPQLSVDVIPPLLLLSLLIHSMRGICCFLFHASRIAFNL